MLKIRNCFIVFAVVFAISSAYAMIGMRDAKAQDAAAYTDLMNRIEALEAKGAGNVTAPKIRGLKIGFEIRHRFEEQVQFVNNSGLGTVTRAGSVITRGQPTNSFSRTGIGRTNDADFVLQRTRIYLDADVNKNIRGYIKLQDTRTFGESGTTGNLQRLDMLEGYVDLRNLGDLSSMLGNVTVRVGRWQNAYGNQRLLGALNWANQSRTYDGARVKWANGKNLWIDAFGFMVNEEDTGAVSGSDLGVTDIGGRANTGAQDEVLYGVYAQYKFGGALKGALVEPYFIGRSRSADLHDLGLLNPVAGSRETGEDRYTFGFRLDGRDMESLPGVDFTVEPVWQTGTVRGLRAAGTGGALADSTAGVTALGGASNDAQNDIQAWAIYAGVGYTFKNMPWTPRIGYAYSFASGDDDPDRGASKTFDQLYPTQHAHNGYMDQAAWQNIRDHQIHFSVRPTEKLTLDFKAHLFSLDEEADNWYGVGGGTGFGGSRFVTRAGADQFTDASGNLRDVDDELGQEIDFTAKYQMFKNFGVVFGYSHFFAGDFIEDTSAGVGPGDRGMDWFYLQTTMKF